MRTRTRIDVSCVVFNKSLMIILNIISFNLTQPTITRINDLSIVRERVVSLEAQTRTNEAKITALFQTLKHANVRQTSFAQEATKHVFLSSSTSEKWHPYFSKSENRCYFRAPSWFIQIRTDKTVGNFHLRPGSVVIAGLGKEQASQTGF